MEAILPILVMVVVFGLVLAVNKSVNAGRQNALRELARRLDRGRASLPTGWFVGVSSYAVTGELDGYRVRTTFFLRGGKHKTLYVQYGVRVPEAAGRVDVSKASFLHDFGKWLGLVEDIETGDAEADRRYAIRGSARTARHVFSHDEAKRRFDILFDRGFREVTLQRGTLRGYRRAGRFTAASFLADLEQLVALARLFTRKKIEIKGLGDEPRFAWTAGRGDPLCPYCRDTLSVDGTESVEACAHCQTLHHAECFAEAGGCTVLGCRGRGGPRRRRA